MTAEGSNADATATRCLTPAKHSLSDRELAVDVELLAAVAVETRYEALRIVANTDGGVCGCELEPTLGVSQSAVSQALSRLHDAGLLTRRVEGRWRYYETTDGADRLLELLDQTRSIGEDEADRRGDGDRRNDADRRNDGGQR